MITPKLSRRKQAGHHKTCVARLERPRLQANRHRKRSTATLARPCLLPIDPKRANTNPYPRLGGNCLLA